MALEKNAVTPKEHFNHYGTLITVLSFLLIVIYGQGCYDIWDFTLAIIGICFALSYIVFILSTEFSLQTFYWFPSLLLITFILIASLQIEEGCRHQKNCKFNLTNNSKGVL